MENKIGNNDPAFSSMLEAIDIMNTDQENIANLTRDLNQLEEKIKCDLKKVQQYAANYFTKDKIIEMHRLCLEVLKTSCFNEDEYIEKFSDSTKFDISDINFLIELQNNIIEVQEKLNSNSELSKEEQIQIKGLARIMHIFADILSRKDGANVN